MTTHGYRTSVRTSRGATPPPSLNMQHEDCVHHRGQGPINERFSRTVISKNETSFQQEGSSLRISRRPYAQKVTIFQSESRGKEMPNQKGW